MDKLKYKYVGPGSVTIEIDNKTQNVTCGDVVECEKSISNKFFKLIDPNYRSKNHEQINIKPGLHRNRKTDQ